MVGFNLWGDDPEPVATPVKSKKAPVKSAPKKFVPEIEAPRSGEGSPKKGYIRTASGYIYNSLSGRKASISPGVRRGCPRNRANSCSALMWAGCSSLDRLRGA